MYFNRFCPFLCALSDPGQLIIDFQMNCKMLCRQIDKEKKKKKYIYCVYDAIWFCFSRYSKCQHIFHCWTVENQTNEKWNVNSCAIVKLRRPNTPYTSNSKIKSIPNRWKLVSACFSSYFWLYFAQSYGRIFTYVNVKFIYLPITNLRNWQFRQMDFKL